MDFDSVFPALPPVLRRGLEKHYTTIKTNFIQGRFEPSELNGAKFCEVVFRILEWRTTTPPSYTALGTRIPNFGQATRRFENAAGEPDSVRFHIPMLLAALYPIRNKRGVGHVGGDVDPNRMDSSLVTGVCDWIMADLVRLFHGTTTIEAEQIVEAIVTRQVPSIWEIDGVKRVLDPSLTYKDRTLLLLYSMHPSHVTDKTLVNWTEHSNLSVFRRDVLEKCHRGKLVEYRRGTGEVWISPTGIRYVEGKLASHLVV